MIFLGCDTEQIIPEETPVITEITYSTNKILKEKFGEVVRFEFDEEETNETVLFSVESFYDAQGNLSEYYTYDEWGNDNYASVYSYNSGNLITNKQVYYYGEPAYREVYQYYENGKTKSYEYYLNRDFLLAKIDYIYDETNVTRIYSKGDGQQIRKEVFVYNKYGSLTEYTAYNETNVPYYKYEYDYDRYGTVTEEKEYQYFMEDSEWVEKITTTTLYNIEYRE